MSLPTTTAALPEAKRPLAVSQDMEQASVDEIVARGPRGAIALCVFAVGVVLALWLAFYLFVFLPRGTIG